MPRRRNDRILKLIALFRWAKAIVLIGAAAGALRLLHPGAAALLQQWARQLPQAAQNRFVLRSIATIAHLPTHRIEWAVAGMLAYAALFTVEGIGLWRAGRWAEWLTIVATTSFIPFEVYELWRHATALRGALVAVNVAIVVYLAWRVRRQA